MKNTLAGAAAALCVAAPAMAELNFFWTYAESGGVVTNTLNFVSDSDSFVAGLTAQTLGGTATQDFQGISGDLMPDGSALSYFSGGYALGDVDYTDPIIIGSTDGSTSAILSGGTIDAGWISNWPEGSFPTGTTTSPVIGGQFALNNSVEGDYTFYLANAAPEDPAINFLTGQIVNGRFSQRLPGDANMDGNVDFLDLSTLAGSFGNTGVSVLDGDFNGDNVVDFLDLSTLAGNFGTNSSAALTAGDLQAVGLGEYSAALVPEPTSLALLAIGGLFVGSRRRR